MLPDCSTDEWAADPRSASAGVLAHGFTRVRCERCKDELLGAFSCKGRGVYLSCNAKRAHVTVVHLMGRMLQHVPYRQWKLSFPHWVRWMLLKDVRLLSDVLTLFLRAVCALRQRRAQRQVRFPPPSLFDAGVTGG